MKPLIVIFSFLFFLTTEHEFASDVELMRMYTMDTIYVEVRLPKMWIDSITAYSPNMDECDSTPYITASNDSVRMGCVAADPKYLPLHSLIIIPGYNDNRVCEVLDTGSKIKKRKLDVFFWTKEEAKNYGLKRNRNILLVRYGP